jgi:glycopeptide antibiotics resistance protein
MTVTEPRVGGAAARGGRVRALLVGAFAVYLVLLAWIVLFKLGVPWIGGVDRVIKLVPFLPSAEQGASLPSEVVVNVVLFVPFGLYLGVLAPSWSWRRALGVVGATSLLLEATQYILAIGSSDVTDLLANTLGGAIGLGLFAVLRRRLADRAGAVLTRVCVLGTAILMLAAALFIASPIRFGPPPSGGIGDAPDHLLERTTVSGELAG